ncbi:uroporphyrinogen-III synthase [Candidatus Uabimicrobium amorphum]|uniref:Uroporphyrinogen-III synthase n=1 Tax=Uabimicrobium amorphum TaxID=2596890 RepID=A0A5S9IK63_UABAM|nr:uroporphyrinogen-III synthase [Candidatus Uabimicrobium amorphum]BBM83037.1 uroporphyrinogen-III synthase [Candidatus Uabimicrobium amorphum]
MQRRIFYTGSKKPPQSDLHLLWTPTIAIEYSPPTNQEKLQQMMAQECRYVFFSRHGVIGFRKHFALPPHAIVYAVGKTTCNCIRDIWDTVSVFTPEEQNALGMIKLFERQEKPFTTVVIQGNKGRKEFSDWLTENNWPFLTSCVYQNTLRKNDVLQKHWQNNENEYVLFTSPSTVKGFLYSIAAQDLQNVASRLMSIGPTTSNAIREHGGKVHYQCLCPDIQDLIRHIP